MLLRILSVCILLLGLGLNSNAQQLNLSISRASNFLKKSQLESGIFQDSTNALFNTWETILVTDALLDLYSFQDTSVQKAMQYLSSMENENQLICHNSKCQKNYCIETSAEYLKLLSKFCDTLNLTSRLQFINQLQEMDGSWKVGNPDVMDKVNFPSVTAFVLNLFDTLNFQNKNIGKSLEFLNETQLDDGSWGQTWEYYNTPGYALWQVLPAIRNHKQCEAAFQKGKNFILNTQLADGSWNFRDDKIKNHVSAELQTVLMLSCLVDEKDATSLITVEKGIQFLISRQLPNGSWDGGFFPIQNERYKKREYLFATALIVKLLVKVNN